MVSRDLDNSSKYPGWVESGSGCRGRWLPFAREQDGAERSGRCEQGLVGSLEAELAQADRGLDQPVVEVLVDAGEDIEPEQLLLAAGSGAVRAVV